MWQEAARALPDAPPPAEAARAKAAPPSSRQSTVEPSAGSSSRRASGPQRRSAAAGALRFFLGKSSSVVDAPSIGEKAAADLQQAGIRTVRDLLQADPASVAEELAIPRLTAERIVQWQRQARLMCCVPELRGYGAQLLVACGIGEPQQLAAADAAKLGARIDKLCRTTAGQRMLRGSKPPSRQRVAQWIAMAARRRPLEAA
jgi:hypothetical protein